PLASPVYGITVHSPCGAAASSRRRSATMSRSLMRHRLPVVDRLVHPIGVLDLSARRFADITADVQNQHLISQVDLAQVQLIQPSLLLRGGALRVSCTVVRHNRDREDDLPLKRQPPKRFVK